MPCFFSDGSGGLFAADERPRDCAWANAVIIPRGDGALHLKCGEGSPPEGEIQTASKCHCLGFWVDETGGVLGYPF